MNIKTEAKISSFYATDKRKTTFIVFANGLNKKIGQLMFTTENIEVSGQDHEKLVNNLVGAFNHVRQ